MNVKGNSYQTVVIRSTPKVENSPSNAVGKLYAQSTFTGVVIVNGAERWIKLQTVNDKPVTGEQYVASWVVNIQVVESPAEPSEDDPFVKSEYITASGNVFEYDMTLVQKKNNG